MSDSSKNGGSLLESIHGPDDIKALREQDLPQLAQEVRDKLGEAGVKTYVEKVSTKDGERTRVRAGPYASKDAAETARGKVAGLGFKGATVVSR